MNDLTGNLQEHISTQEDHTVTFGGLKEPLDNISEPLGTQLGFQGISGGLDKT